MKMYITGYRRKKEFVEAEKAGKPLPEGDNCDVQFSANPSWRFSGNEWAQAEFNIVRDMRIHTGDHYCELELEQLADDEFAIICKDHPAINT